MLDQYQMDNTSDHSSEEGEIWGKKIWPTDILYEYFVQEIEDCSKNESAPLFDNDSFDRKKIQADIMNKLAQLNLFYGIVSVGVIILLFVSTILKFLPFCLMSIAVIFSICLVFLGSDKKSLTKMWVWLIVMSFIFQVVVLISIPICKGLTLHGGRSIIVVASIILSLGVGGFPKNWLVCIGGIHFFFYYTYITIESNVSCFDLPSPRNHVLNLYKESVVFLFQCIVPLLWITVTCLRIYDGYNVLIFKSCSACFDLGERSSQFGDEVSSVQEQPRQSGGNINQFELVRANSANLVSSESMTENEFSEPDCVKTPLNVQNINLDGKFFSNSFLSAESSKEQERKSSPLNHSRLTLSSTRHSIGNKESSELKKTASVRSHNSLFNISLNRSSVLNSLRRRSTIQPGMKHNLSYVTFFSLPRLKNYVCGPASYDDLAQMVLAEFTTACHAAITSWDGEKVMISYSTVVARFSNPMDAVAAATHLQVLLRRESQHHKDPALIMSMAHRPLTATILCNLFYGVPCEVGWRYGVIPAERLMENIIDLHATSRAVPENLVATTLVEEIEDLFNVVTSDINLSWSRVKGAFHENEEGIPSFPRQYLDFIPPKEPPELPLFETGSASHYGSLHRSSTIRGGNQLPPMASSPTNKGGRRLPPAVIEVWNSLDMDQNGFLELNEFEQLIKRIGLPMSKDEIRKLFAAIDFEQTGHLTYDEFEEEYFKPTIGGAVVMNGIRRSAFVMAQSNEKEFLGIVDKLWHKYDPQGQQKLEEPDIQNLLKDLGMVYTSQEISWLVDRLDKDKNGYIDFDEFIVLFSPDASEFNAVKERIQAVSRVMLNKSQGITVQYSTPEQNLRDYRVMIKEAVEKYGTPFIFTYIWYVFGTTTFKTSLGASDDNIRWIVVDLWLDILYATWCVLKMFYIPRENRGGFIIKNLFKYSIKTPEFYIDLLTIIPVGILYFIIGYPRNGGIMAYYRLNKVLSLYHLDWCYKLFTRPFNPAVARAANAMLYFFVFCHIFACGLIYLTRVVGQEAMQDMVFDNGALIDNKGTTFYQAFYWATLTLAGQLSGVTIPVLREQVFFYVLIVLVSLPMYTVVLGTIGTAVNVEDTYSKYLEKIDNIKSYFEYTRLPKAFEDETIGYYRHLYETTNTLDITENPLDDLPVELSIPLTIAMGRDMLKSVPIFKSASANLEFVHELTTKLVPKVIEPFAVVMRKGDVGTEMYFITYGNFNIVVEGVGVVFTLGKGNFFGEIALLHSGKRTATIINSSRYGNVLVLDKEPFQEVARFFPDCLSQVYKAAEDRIKQMKDKEKEEASKLPPKEIEGVKDDKGGTKGAGPSVRSEGKSQEKVPPLPLSQIGVTSPPRNRHISLDNVRAAIAVRHPSNNLQNPSGSFANSPMDSPMHSVRGQGDVEVQEEASISLPMSPRDAGTQQGQSNQLSLTEDEENASIAMFSRNESIISPSPQATNEETANPNIPQP